MKMHTEKKNISIKMKVDIFIKTYSKDFPWLQYCLASIRKFAQGFQRVIIVCDGQDGTMIPYKWLWPQCKVFYVTTPNTFPSKCEHTPGYVFQQAVKLNWIKYSDADAVLILDSDWMFSTSTCPDDFKIDNEFYWVYRDWDKADDAVLWKSPVEIALKQNAEYEAMVVAGFILTRDATVAFQRHLCALYNAKDIWDCFLKINTKHYSEFNLFGMFVLHYRDDYKKLFNYDTSQLHNTTIRSSWSWGGLTSEEIVIRQQILDS